MKEEYSKVPDWFKNWETTGLISFDDKNNDGKIQYLANPSSNELVVDRDIMVIIDFSVIKDFMVIIDLGLL